MNDVCSIYDIDYVEIERFIREHRVRKILLQAPNGLKKLIPCVLNSIDRDRYRIFISNTPTYGGCDLAIDEAVKLGVDSIIHIGHNQYPYLTTEVNIPVLYIPAYYIWKPSVDFIKNIVETLSREGALSIGIVSTIQHVRSINELSRNLEEYGFKIYIGRSNLNNLETGQVIGCDYSAINSIDKYVDTYIVVSGGRFHALGLALVTNKRVYGLDPYREQLWNTSSYVRKIYAKRYYLLTRLKHGGFRKIGIVIGMKPGQFRPSVFEKIIRISEENNIEYYNIVTNELNNERLIAIDNALDLDTYIVTSCPRLPIDDLGDFYKPVLTPGEYYMLLNKELDKYIYPW